jgi:hypothetical protein
MSEPMKVLLRFLNRLAAASDFERARAITWCLAANNSGTIAEPMNPVAPVTNIRILNFLLTF